MNTFDLDAWLRFLARIGGRYFVLAGITFLLFYVLFRNKLQHRLIQHIFPKPFHYYRDIIFSIISILIFASVAYLTLIVCKPINNIWYGSVQTFGVGYYIAGFFWMFFLHDTWFYWIHRLMHHPLLFKTVHLVHHKSTNPSPWTAYAFHPAEAVLEAAIIPLIAFTIPVQRTGIMFFMLFQIIYNVYGHLGYELFTHRFLQTRFGKWINSGTAHNGHHKYFTGNYGLYTRLWDRWMNTTRKDQA
jgi:Delta7-sterol 5-desaturase